MAFPFNIHKLLCMMLFISIKDNSNINKNILKNFGNINNNIYDLKEDLNNDQININDKSNDLYLNKPYINNYTNLNSNFPQINPFSILPQSNYNFLVEPINNKLNDKLDNINSSNDLLINAISKDLLKNRFKEDNL